MRATLDQLLRSLSTPQGLARRSRIVLAAASGQANQKIGILLRIPDLALGPVDRRRVQVLCAGPRPVRRKLRKVGPHTFLLHPQTTICLHQSPASGDLMRRLRLDNLCGSVLTSRATSGSIATRGFSRQIVRAVRKTLDVQPRSTAIVAGRLRAERRRKVQKKGISEDLPRHATVFRQIPL